MIIYYIRHGEPNYELDCLTELGKKQAESLSNRLAKLHIDEIYVSPIHRAQETAEPTVKKFGIAPVTLEFLSEGMAWKHYAREFQKGKPCWLFLEKDLIGYLNSPEVISLGNKWYDAPRLKQYGFEQSDSYFKTEVHSFMEKQGYKWDEESNTYIEVSPNDKRILMFAHEGNSKAFLSALLNLPYPFVSTHFEFGHTCIHRIIIKPISENDKHCIPRFYGMSVSEHLYNDEVLMYFDYMV